MKRMSNFKFRVILIPIVAFFVVACLIGTIVANMYSGALDWQLGMGEKHIVQVDGENVTLTLKEFEILCLLLKNQGICFTRDRLLNEIWGYAFDQATRTVDVHIRTLRQKLGSAGDLIETVRGIGYKIGEQKL